MACAVLHNIAQQTNAVVPEHNDDDDEEMPEELHIQDGRDGMRQRQLLIRQHFN